MVLECITSQTANSAAFDALIIEREDGSYSYSLGAGSGGGTDLYVKTKVGEREDEIAREQLFDDGPSGWSGSMTRMWVSAPADVTIAWADWGTGRTTCRFLVNDAEVPPSELDPSRAIFRTPGDYAGGVAMESPLLTAAALQHTSVNGGGFQLGWILQGSGTTPSGETVNDVFAMQDPGEWKFEIDSSMELCGCASLFMLDLPA